MKNATLIIAVVLSILYAPCVMAQQRSVPADSLTATIARLSKTVQVLDRIKLSGYIQSQFQVTDTLGAKSFDGGDFAKASSKRFMVRRGYFKVAYEGNLSSYVVQVNLNEKGFSLRDAYFSVREPWLKAITLTGGIFYRPFGYELSYSASQRESPELSRLDQELFPLERDMGADITFQMPEKSALHPFKLEAGFFTGNGTNAETDNKLDFIGRLGYSDATADHKFSYGIGVSYYNGSVYQAKKQVYQIGLEHDTLAFTQDMSQIVPGKYQKREYYGFDGQFIAHTLAGTTTVRVDYVYGSQPASDTSSMSPTDKVGAPLYLRKFQGGVVYFVQNFFNSIHSIVLKFDYYDPNTKIKGDQIGLPALGAITTNGTDIAYSTWGFGYFADVTNNLRFTIYYDLVKNETSKHLAKYGNDLKDNVFTVRAQYKF